jgi:hypothetical protein
MGTKSPHFLRETFGGGPDSNRHLSGCAPTVHRRLITLRLSNSTTAPPFRRDGRKLFFLLQFREQGIGVLNRCSHSLANVHTLG